MKKGNLILVMYYQLNYFFNTKKQEPFKLKHEYVKNFREQNAPELPRVFIIIFYYINNYFRTIYKVSPDDTSYYEHTSQNAVKVMKKKVNIF